MKQPIQKIQWLFILLWISLNSCVSLKHINDFSSSSLKAVSKFEEINYSFNQNCLENCQYKKNIELNLNAIDCDCALNEKADSITHIIYTAVRGYLDGLNNLSKNDLTTYKMDALTKALKEGNFGNVKIEKDQVEAYGKISKILLKAFTDRYRKRKLAVFVKEANEPIKQLLSYLNFNLSANLAGKLNVQKQRIKSYYFDLSKDQTLSGYEKIKVVEEYYYKFNQIETKQKELFLYSKLLKKIENGHQKLFDNIAILSKKEAREQVTQYASDLLDIITEFNKLNILKWQN